jgi:hypothetical protein
MGVCLNHINHLPSANRRIREVRLPAGSATADTFTGYGGVGDYARANGNTWSVVQAAHRLRDGAFSEARSTRHAERRRSCARAPCRCPTALDLYERFNPAAPLSR